MKCKLIEFPKRPPLGGCGEKTGEKRLLRHRHSGQYYFRYKLDGKQKWVSLGTDVKTTAVLRMMDKHKKVMAQRGRGPQVVNANASMGELMDTYLAESRSNADLRPSTVECRVTDIKKIEKTWPGIRDLKPQRITTQKIWEWANSFKQNGTKFKAPNSKTVRKGNSSSSVNRAIDALRHVLDLARHNQQIMENPVVVKTRQGRLKMKVIHKKLDIPSRAHVVQLIQAMKEAGRVGGWGMEAALMCSFLILTGARIGECNRTLWRYVNEEKNEIFLPGYKTDAAPRTLPLFPELPSLLREIKEWRKSTAHYHPERRLPLSPEDPIFAIKECQKTINAACEKIGIKRITHHGFRHVFATGAMEAGVDVKTLSEWLGHADGGVLAQKTYGHLRTEHSQRSAAKVLFWE